jgi:hypothetical protein
MAFRTNNRWSSVVLVSNMFCLHKMYMDLLKSYPNMFLSILDHLVLPHLRLGLAKNVLIDAFLVRQSLHSLVK